MRSGGSAIIPVALFIICFPETGVMLLATGVLILIVFAIVVALTNPGGNQ